MAEVSIIGDQPATWSNEAVKFASDLADIAQSDRELAAMIVHVAMNIVGASAFQQGVEPEEVVGRVIHVADAKLDLLRKEKLQ